MHRDHRYSISWLSTLLCLVCSALPAMADPGEVFEAVAPDSVQLILPVDQDTLLVSELPVVLQWQADATAGTYEAQVFFDEPAPGDEPIPFKSKVLIDPSFEIPTQELLDLITTSGDSTFHWRVRARNADGEGPWSQVWQFTISGADVENQAPDFTFTLDADDRTADELVPLEFVITAEDAEGDGITYTLDQASLDAGMLLDPDTGEFSWTPDEAQGPGTFEVQITATDDGMPPAVSDTTITLIVNEVNLAPELAAIADTTIDAGTELTFTAEATDEDLPANTLTFTLEGGEPGMDIDPLAGTFTWVPADTGQFVVTVIVTDDSDPALSDSVEVTIQVTGEPLPDNLPPAFTFDLDADDRTTDELVPLEFVITAEDAEGDGITYTLDQASLDAGMLLDPDTGEFSWTPDEAQGPGTFEVQITATDDGMPPAVSDTTITLIVNEVNLAPELAAIADTTIDAGTELTFTAEATDEDLPANTLTFTLEGGEPGMDIDPLAGTFTWVPADTGQFVVTVIVTDDSDPALSDSVEVTIQVTGEPLPDNLPPAFTFDLDADDRTTDELVSLEFVITAEDAEGDGITYTLDQASLDAGMLLDPDTGEFSWTPDEAQGPGTFEVQITATDDGMPPAVSDTTITLIVNEVNLAPELAAIADTTIDAGTELTFTAEATDEDLPANTLTFTLEGGEPGMDIDPLAGTFTWVPADTGQFVVTVIVTDDSDPALSDSVEVTIQVTGEPLPDNLPPAFTFDLDADDRTTDELVSLEFVITAEDAEGDGITYTLDQASLDAGMLLDPDTGEFSWTPDEAQGPGTFEVQITATDDGMPPAVSDTTITLIVNEVNLAPELAAIADTTIDAGTELTFTAEATDEDLPANTLTFTLEGGEPGMDIDPLAGTFTWVPADTGQFVVTVIVTDDSDPALSDSVEVTIQVTGEPLPDNLPPAFTFDLDADDRTTDELVSLEFVITAEDAEGDGITYTLDQASLDAGMLLDPDTGEFSWTPDEAQGPGTFEVQITATDDGMPPAVSDTTITLIVNEVNLAPELAAIADTTIDAGTELTFTAEATDEDLPANTLTFTLEGGEPGMDIDPLAGTFTWVPADTGQFVVTVIVTDDSDPALSDSVEVTIQVTGEPLPENQAPTFTFTLGADDRTTDELAALEFAITAEDADGDIITFALDQASLDAGMMLDPDTGAFSWTPSEAQGPDMVEVQITATDDGVPAAVSDTTITLIVNEVNLAPDLAVVADTSAIVGEELALTATALDADIPSNTLVFSLQDGEPGMEISTAGDFTWTPEEIGQFTVTIFVTDDGEPALSDSTEVTIGVSDGTQGGNMPPVFTFNLDADDLTTDELVALDFMITADDADGDSIAFTLDQVSTDAGMVLDPETGAFTWTPNEAQGPGSFEVEITARDNGTPRAVSTTTITLVVNEVNLPPELNSIANLSGFAGDAVEFTATATDPDLPANTLTFSLANAEPGMTIDPQTGQFNWTLPAGDLFSVTVVVSDDGAVALSDSQLIDIEVIALPPAITQSEILSASFCSIESTSLLQWTAVQADSFLIEIDTDPLFASPDIATRTANASLNAPLDALDTDVVYYWRVSAEVAGQLGVPSPPQPFRRWPAAIQVQHTLAFPKATESGDFRMISVPGQSEQITVAATFPGQVPFEDWRVYTDDSEDAAYPIYLSPVNPEEQRGELVFRPGRGFWALSTSSWQVAAQQIPSATLDTQTSSFFAIPLAQGATEADARWTMIGNPFDFPVRWQDILDANSISGDDELWEWVGDRYVASPVMEPYKGYYVFNRDNNPVLNMPCYLEPATDLVGAPLPAPEHDGLVLSVHNPLDQEEKGASVINIGWHEEANEMLDTRDQFVPPAFFEPYRLTLINETLQTVYPYLKKEYRKSVDESQVFDIELKAVPGERYVLQTTGMGALATQEVFLFDRATGQAFDLHQTSEVYLEPENEISRLMLVIGDATFIDEQKQQLIPEEFLVRQSYPNPFAERVTIEYSLADPVFVELSIYNILGQRVRTLIAAEKEAGFHQMEWDGTSDTGEGVASGVYMYVFKAGAYQSTQRLVRVR